MNVTWSSRRSRTWLRRSIGFLGLFLPLILMNSVTKAQVADERWDEPFRLSQIGARVGEPALVADRFGGVSVFWGEWFPASGVGVVQHSRFDGESWSESVDIVASAEGRIIRVAVDQGPDGVLHMLWSTGADLMYTSVPAELSHLAQEWSKSELVVAGIVPNYFRIRVAPDGRMHVAYSTYLSDDSGIFHLTVPADFNEWPQPSPIDVDIHETWSPWVVQLVLGEDRVVHAVWQHGDQNGAATTIRYARSLDEGGSWSTPIDVFKPDPSIGLNAAIAYPSLMTSRGEVHLLWAASRTFDDGTRYGLRRLHQMSLDDGATWSSPTWVFDELGGMAAGDGLVSDGAGRVHWITQVRPPMGIHHAVWSDTAWSEPELAYEISAPGSPEIDGGIHVHNTRAAVRAGSQLVIAFTTAPTDEEQALFAMVRDPFDTGAQTPAPPANISERNERAKPSIEPPAAVATGIAETETEESMMPTPNRPVGTLNPGASESNRLLFFVGIVPLLLLMTAVLIRLRGQIRSR